MVRISDVSVEGIVNDIEITLDLSETGYSYKKEKDTTVKSHGGFRLRFCRKYST